MILVWIAAVCLVLIAINAIFVAAEFALIAAPKPLLERHSSGGDRLARHVLSVIESATRQDRYIATAQLGITLASLGLGMYGEHQLAGLVESWIGGRLSAAARGATAAAFALLLLTVGHIVLGEMLPKGLALKNPVAVARWAHWPMQATLWLLYPFVIVLNGIANMSLGLLGIRRTSTDQAYTPEELQIIVEESERGGTIRGESGRILRELFEFGDRTAAEVMVPRVHVVGIHVGADADEVRRAVLDHGRTRYPVYDGDLDHVVGMVHAKDLLRALIERKPLDVAEIKRVPVVPESASLDDVLATMREARAHMAVVIDEHGGTAGIVNLEDIFEEVVGELDDGIEAERALVPDSDGTVVVAGTLRLDELGQHLDLDLEHDEVDSVSGLVLTLLGRPPVDGDVVTHDRIRIEVTATAGRGVKQARVTLVGDSPDSPR